MTHLRVCYHEDIILYDKPGVTFQYTRTVTVIRKGLTHGKIEVLFS